MGKQLNQGVVANMAAYSCYDEHGSYSCYDEHGSSVFTGKPPALIQIPAEAGAEARGFGQA